MASLDSAIKAEVVADEAWDKAEEALASADVVKVHSEAEADQAAKLVVDKLKDTEHKAEDRAHLLQLRCESAEALSGACKVAKDAADRALKAALLGLKVKHGSPFSMATTLASTTPDAQATAWHDYNEKENRDFKLLNPYAGFGLSLEEETDTGNIALNAMGDLGLNVLRISTETVDVAAGLRLDTGATKSKEGFKAYFGGFGCEVGMQDGQVASFGVGLSFVKFNVKLTPKASPAAGGEEPRLR